MRRETSEETRQSAIKLYRNGKNTIKEISNLTGVHVATLTNIFRKCFENNELTPRKVEFALHHRTPNGQGKDRSPSGIGSGGRSHERKKFSAEQEHQIAFEYYEKGLSFSQIKQKWGVHPMQMQRIRNKYKPMYGMKNNAPNYCKDRYEELQKEQKGE